jgi:hypothetical protein
MNFGFSLKAFGLGGMEAVVPMARDSVGGFVFKRLNIDCDEFEGDLKTY